MLTSTSSGTFDAFNFVTAHVYNTRSLFVLVVLVYEERFWWLHISVTLPISLLKFLTGMFYMH